MFQIKKSQMDLFDAAALKDFEDETVLHVKKHFPKHYQFLGDDKIRGVIRHGIRRAHGHGLTTQRSMCLYITLMMMLGSNFDIDLHLPWAAEILGDPTPMPQSARVNRLTDAALKYLDRIAGKDSLHINRALFRMRRALPKIAAQPLLEDMDLTESMLTQLGQIFPRKYDAVGEALVRSALHQGMKACGQYGMTTDQDVAVYTGLAFALGTGFDEDPLFSVFSEILRSDAGADPRPKAARLCEAGTSVLDFWLSPA